MTTPHRASFAHHAPDMLQAFRSAGAAVRAGMLEKKLIELVWMRASQLNGCAYCLDLHTRDSLKAGEDLQRIACLAGWREAEMYSPRERAALAWSEALTDLQDGHGPEADYAALQAVFSEKEIAELTGAIALINAWNRIMVGLRAPVRANPMSAAAG